MAQAAILMLITFEVENSLIFLPTSTGHELWNSLQERYGREGITQNKHRVV